MILPNSQTNLFKEGFEPLRKSKMKLAAPVNFDGHGANSSEHRSRCERNSTVRVHLKEALFGSLPRKIVVGLNVKNVQSDGEVNTMKVFDAIEIRKLVGFETDER